MSEFSQFFFWTCSLTKNPSHPFSYPSLPPCLQIKSFVCLKHKIVLILWTKYDDEMWMSFQSIIQLQYKENPLNNSPNLSSTKHLYFFSNNSEPFLSLLSPLLPSNCPVHRLIVCLNKIVLIVDKWSELSINYRIWEPT